jgi:para-aminobenzoate synthetase component I
MTKDEFVSTVNNWGRNRIPFLFLVDFEMEKPMALRLDSINSDELLFNINGFANQPSLEIARPSITIQNPLTFQEYRRKFSLVFHYLSYGDSYLTNLTVKTPVIASHTLRDLFFASRAKYKLLYKDEFLVFSPESFIRIEEGTIFSYPMKGTIDAAVPDAKRKILMDAKELAEHVTIVDLIRNDLSLVSDNVQVTRFRYIDEITTHEGKLLQVSSEIRGDLPVNYEEQLGRLLLTLLPAGSVSGAPKPRTLEIIREAEQEKRGFYTGVFGYFDGNKLDSGVMIRFVEKVEGALYYRSGGGITTQSVAEKEYQEIMDKVYVPVD